MIKKSVLVCILLVLLPVINAGSIGISPTNFEFFFEPNLEKTFEFKVSNANPQAGIETYVAGDLADYVNLSDNFFIGEGVMQVSLKLPSKIDIPGKHRILIGAREAQENNSQSSSGVGGIAAIQAVIDIYVPYPGKYVEAEFKLENINKGENALFELMINNLGSEKININPVIEIYDEEKLIQTKTISIGELKSKQKTTITDFLDSSEFKEGVYQVVVTIDYGKQIKIEKELKVGYLFVNIIDYDYQFIKGKINPFNINVENLWNLEMKNVYSEVSITNNGKVLTSFKTPSVNMKAWEKVNLTGFFDASDIEEGKYTANIRVFYDGEINSKLVAIYVLKPEFNKVWIIGGITAIIIILFLLLFFVYLILKIKKLKKDVKKKK
ncbi:MAG: hypothetical protein WCX73_02345 [Candidatus Pacearchaeota archaeon]|jgi:hypothetical protein